MVGRQLCSTGRELSQAAGVTSLGPLFQDTLTTPQSLFVVLCKEGGGDVQEGGA